MTVGITGAKLFGRSGSLVIGSPNDPTVSVEAKFSDTNGQGFDLTGLTFEFVVEKSIIPTEPNTCSIKVYNLSPSTRQSLSGVQKLTVRLEAGYGAFGVSQIYFAEARAAWTTRVKTDYITHIESTDSIARPTGVRHSKQLQPGDLEGSIYRTTGPKVPLADALRALVKAMGVGSGNLEQLLAGPGLSATLPLKAVNGGALLGNTARRMTDLCRSAGLQWFIEDGNIVVLNIGQALSTTNAILLNNDTGLIESPSVDSQGALSFTTLLIPDIRPGVLVQMDSEFVKGGYRIEKVRYVGNVRGQEWYCHVEAQKY